MAWLTRSASMTLISFDEAIATIDRRLSEDPRANNLTLVRGGWKLVEPDDIDRQAIRDWLYSGMNFGISVHAHRRLFRRRVWRVQACGWAGGMKDWLAMGNQLICIHEHL